VFLEPSAIVEFIAEGPHAVDVGKRIKAAKTPFSVSPTAIFEATSVLASRLKISVENASDLVTELAASVGAQNMSITPEIGEIAIKAMAQYGKGRGHPAQLNFGDCFSYACAKSADVPLLYVGQDFAKTDLA
jgi:ribonuclease VapC